MAHWAGTLATDSQTLRVEACVDGDCAAVDLAVGGPGQSAGRLRAYAALCTPRAADAGVDARPPVHPVGCPLGSHSADAAVPGEVGLQISFDVGLDYPSPVETRLTITDATGNELLRHEGVFRWAETDGGCYLPSAPVIFSP